MVVILSEKIAVKYINTYSERNVQPDRFMREYYLGYSYITYLAVQREGEHRKSNVPHKLVFLDCPYQYLVILCVIPPTVSMCRFNQ